MTQPAPLMEPAPPLEWAAAGRPISGEVVSGDRSLVRFYRGGVLLAVVDGLGHGLPAAQAASAAVELIASLTGEPLERIMRRCHAELRETRGVVLSLVAFDPQRSLLSFCGIGNPNGLLLRPGPGGAERHELEARGGVVGKHMPAPRVISLAVEPGDVLILPTDGIRQRFASALDLSSSAEQLAIGICAGHARETDDALVLVARFTAPGG